MGGYFAILTAIPGFFLSSCFVMLLTRALAGPLGINALGYVDAMKLTITLWIAVAPLVTARRRRH